MAATSNPTKAMKNYAARNKTGKLKFFKSKHSFWLNAGTITKASKLEAKNANRSIKKSARQQAKTEIKNELDQ